MCEWEDNIKGKRKGIGEFVVDIWLRMVTSIGLETSYRIFILGHINDEHFLSKRRSASQEGFACTL
jgi:hypothetical protein